MIRPLKRDLSRMRRARRGVMLIEVLVSILIFSIAILGIVALQAVSIRNVRDADYRAEASMYANQIIGSMWADRFNVPTYALNAADAVPCGAGANGSANAQVDAWLDSFTDPASPGVLPGAANLKQQIAVAPNNIVTLTICWQAPQDTAPHNYSITAQIQG